MLVNSVLLLWFTVGSRVDDCKAHLGHFYSRQRQVEISIGSYITVPRCNVPGLGTTSAVNNCSIDLLLIFNFKELNNYFEQLIQFINTSSSILQSNCPSS